MNDRIDDMNDTTEKQAGTLASTPRRAARHLLWIVPLALAAAVAAVWLLTGSGNAGDEPAAVATLDFEEVVVTDLTEGEHLIKIKVWDLAGNFNITTASFMVD